MPMQRQSRQRPRRLNECGKEERETPYAVACDQGLMQSKALKAVTVTLRTNQRLLKPLLTVGLAQQQQVICTAAASATQVKMLRRLHNHIFACKLKEVFESQVVLVYQTMGHIDHLGLKQQVQAGLAKEPSVKDAHFKVCQMRNSVAVATGDDTLSKLFTNSNLLIGFKLPEQQQQLQQQQDGMQPLLEQQQHQQQQDAQYQGLISAALQKVQYDMSPQQVVGGLLDHPQPGPHVPQPALKAFVETGVQLPSEQPLVLIGAFYKSSATPLSRLRKWIKLDARQVYGELLGVLDAPVTELLAFEGCAEDLVACLDEAGGADVAEVLDTRLLHQPVMQTQPRRDQG